jgi:hypothetical protein
MPKPASDSLFVHWYPTGIVTATLTREGNHKVVGQLHSFATIDNRSQPFSVLSELFENRKGYVEAGFSVSHPAFFHLSHEVDNLLKAKAPDYFPNWLKGQMTSKTEDVFYYVLNIKTGGLYDPDNIEDKRFLLSGIATSDLVAIQDQIVENSFYPSKLECASLDNYALLRRLMDDSGSDKPMIYIEMFRDDSLMIILPPEGLPVVRRIHCGELAVCEKIKDELTLKDTSASQKLLHSNTIDLSDIGHKIVSPIYREIAAIIGLFEVETGQSAGHLFFANTAPNQNWMADILAKDLGVEVFRPSKEQVQKVTGLQMSSSIEWNMADTRILSLMAMMSQVS